MSVDSTARWRRKQVKQTLDKDEQKNWQAMKEKIYSLLSLDESDNQESSNQETLAMEEDKSLWTLK